MTVEFEGYPQTFFITPCVVVDWEFNVEITIAWLFWIVSIKF
jgi:hypothetical protein